MSRIQVRLTESQAAALKRLAKARGCSVAEIVREGVAHVLASATAHSDENQQARALAASGRFRSGRDDIAERHDAYLDEDLDCLGPND